MRILRLPGLLVLCVASLLVGTHAAAQLLVGAGLEAGPAANPGVLPSFSKAFGKSYGDWSAGWWQWAFSLPTPGHPLLDSAGCEAGQSGRVWFLGGTFAGVPDPTDPTVVIGEADRDCTVPTGKPLFFPIVNVACTTVEMPGATEAELRECANSLADHIQDLAVTIDGAAVEHLGLYRRESGLFTIGPLPADNLLGAAPGATGDAVSDGFWIMLKPLSVGEHDIRFEGAAVFTTADDGFDLTLTQDITYAVTVVP